MVKNNVKKNIGFDTENLRLILLCAIFGIFGVHKFAQHKTGQGILFLILDLTVIGLIITCIWSLVDLIQLTTQKTNPAGNVICGFVLIFMGLWVVSTIGIPEYATIKRITPNIKTISFIDNTPKKVFEEPIDEDWMVEIKDSNINVEKNTNNAFSNNYKTSCKSTTNTIDGKTVYSMHCDCDVDKNGRHFHDSFDDMKTYNRTLTKEEQDCKSRCSAWCKTRSENF